MAYYKITAQAIVGRHVDYRIAKVVWAIDPDGALRQVGQELQDAGYYAIAVDETTAPKEQVQ